MLTNSAVKNATNLVCGVFGGTLLSLLGGWDVALRTLLILMIIDYITGLILAAVFHKSTKTENGRASSNAGFKGIVKKLCILCIIAVAVCIDNAMATDYIRSMTIVFFVANEGLSILENTASMGVPYPQIIKTALEILKDKSDDERK